MVSEIVVTVGEEDGAWNAAHLVLLDEAECDGEARGGFEVLGRNVDEDVLLVRHGARFVCKFKEFRIATLDTNKIDNWGLGAWMLRSFGCAMTSLMFLVSRAGQALL